MLTDENDSDFSESVKGNSNYDSEEEESGEEDGSETDENGMYILLLIIHPYCKTFIM